MDMYFKNLLMGIFFEDRFLGSNGKVGLSQSNPHISLWVNFISSSDYYRDIEKYSS